MFNTDSLQPNKMECNPGVQKEEAVLNKTEVDELQNEKREDLRNERKGEQHNETRVGQQNETNKEQWNKTCAEKQNDETEQKNEKKIGQETDTRGEQQNQKIEKQQNEMNIGQETDAREEQRIETRDKLQNDTREEQQNLSKIGLETDTRELQKETQIGEETGTREVQQNKERVEQQNEARKESQNKTREQQNKSNLEYFIGPLYEEECLEYRSRKPSGSITFALDYDEERPLTPLQLYQVQQMYAEQAITGVALHPIKFYELCKVDFNCSQKSIPEGVRPYWAELYKIFFWLRTGGKQLPTNNNMDLAVVLEGYPYTKMTRQQAEELYECLRPGGTDRSVKFLDIKYDRCAMIFTCSNAATEMWLEYAVSMLNPWFYGVLEVGPADIVVHGIKFGFYIPKSLRTKGSNDILSLIEKHNRKITTRNWYIVERTELFITVWVDNKTMNTLRTSGLIFTLNGRQLELMPVVNLSKLKLAQHLFNITSVLPIQKSVPQHAGKSTVQPPDKGTVAPLQKGATQPLQKGATQPPGKYTAQPTQKIAGQPLQKSAIPPPVKDTAQPLQKSAGQPLQMSAVPPPGKDTAQPLQKSAVPPPGKDTAQPLQKSAGQPLQKSAVPPPGKDAAQPLQKSAGQPLQKSAVLPPGKDTAQPFQKSAGQPLQKVVPQPICKGTAQLVQKDLVQPLPKGATRPPGKDTEQPLQKSAAQTIQKPAAQPLQKSAAQPLQKSAAQPIQKPAAQPLQKSAAQPLQNAAQPLQKSAAQPLQKSGAQPIQKPAAQLIQKSAAQPLQKSAAQPLQKSAAQPLQKSAAQPLQKSGAQPIQKPAAQPLQKSAAQPLQKSAAQPLQKSAAQPLQKSGAQPIQKPAAQPLQKSAVQPLQKSAAQPLQKSAAQPLQKSGAQPIQKPAAQSTQKSAAQEVVAQVPNKNRPVVLTVKKNKKSKKKKKRKTKFTAVEPIHFADNVSAHSYQPYPQGHPASFAESVYERNQYVIPNSVDIYGTVNTVEYQPQAYVCSNPQQFSEHINWTPHTPSLPELGFPHYQQQVYGGGSVWPTGLQESSSGVHSTYQSPEPSKSGILTASPLPSQETFSGLDPYEVNTIQSEKFIAAMITGSPLPSSLQGMSPAVHSLKSNEGSCTERKSQITVSEKEWKLNRIMCTEIKSLDKGKERERKSPTTIRRKRRGSTPPKFPECKSKKLCSVESDNGRYAGKYSETTGRKKHSESSPMTCPESKSIDKHLIESDKGKKKHINSPTSSRKRQRSATPPTFPEIKSKNSHTTLCDKDIGPDRCSPPTGWERPNDSNLLNYPERKRVTLHPVDFDEGRKTVLESKSKAAQSTKCDKERKYINILPAAEAVLKESSHSRFLEKVAEACEITETRKQRFPYLQPQMPDESVGKGSSLSQFFGTTNKTLGLAESKKLTSVDMNPSTTGEVRVSLSHLLESLAKPRATENSNDTEPINSSERTLTVSNMPQFLEKVDKSPRSIRMQGSVEPHTDGVSGMKGLSLSQILETASKRLEPRKHRFVGVEPVITGDAAFNDLSVTQFAERAPSSGSSTGFGNVTYPHQSVSEGVQANFKGPSLTELLEKLAKPLEPRKPYT